MTFDDGPGRYTEDILDILEEASVPAVFFWQSRLLHYKRPWKKTLEYGHKIGSHSHLHVNLAEKPLEIQRKQIKTSVELFEHITGQKPHFFRPPYGQFNEDTIQAAAELDMQVVLWNVASLDWQLKKDPEKIVENVMSAVKPGCIILLHEFEQTASVLEELIHRLKRENYSFSNEL